MSPINNDQIDKLIQRILSEGTDLYISSGAQDSTIFTLEQQLGVNIPQEIRDFLRSYGLMHCCGEGISGIFNDTLDKDSKGTILSDTEQFRSDSRTPNDPYFIVLSYDDDEWYFGMRLGDSRIYSYDALAKEFSEEFSSLNEFIIDFLESQLD